MRLIDLARGEQVKIFNTIAIETSARCNRRCVFCPVHGTQRPDVLMPVETIHSILAQLSAARWHGRIALYIYNEPMMDKRILDIVRLCVRSVPRACVMLSTNGDYFRSRDDIVRVLDSGVKQLLINVYSASDHSGNVDRFNLGVRHAEQRYAKFRAWIRGLDGINGTGSVYTYVSPRGLPVVRVEPKFGIRATDKSLSDYELQNRSGNVPWFQPAVPAPLEQGCVRPFRFLNINWKGDAILCCNDYHGETNFGNVGTQSLVEIWNSSAFNEYRLHLQNRDRNVPLCDKCDYGGGVYRHVINRVTFGQEEDSSLLSNGG